MLGNLHPTSFKDISDKFVWTFDKGTLQKYKVWDKSHGWALLDCSDFSTDALPGPDGLQFIEVTGVAPASEMPNIARGVLELWNRFPEALMIRNTVQVEEAETTAPTVADVRALDLPTRISAELEGTPLHLPWNQYLARAQEA